MKCSNETLQIFHILKVRKPKVVAVFLIFYGAMHLILAPPPIECPGLCQVDQGIQ